MTPAIFAAFIAAAIPAFFTPGPNNLMLMASGAKFGFNRTIPHGAGVAIGFALMVVLVGLGLGEVFQYVPWLKTALEWIAAAYLLYLAWTLLGLKIHAESASEKPLTFLQAAGFQWINPKAWAMAVSFGALVVDPGAGRFIGIAVLGIGRSYPWRAVVADLDDFRRSTRKAAEAHRRRALRWRGAGSAGGGVGRAVPYLGGWG